MSKALSTAQDRLIVALDFPSTALAMEHVASLEGQCRWFKVGLELYLAAGAKIIHTLRDLGFKVFLDLKLHDIPNTVAGAIRALSSSGASLLTVHAVGGAAMLDAAVQAAASSPDAPQLLAVTVLTSMDSGQLSGVGIAVDPASQVLRLAQLALDAGIPGLICSAQELVQLRSKFGPKPRLVVPGIRLVGEAVQDQRRVATPSEAFAAGASMIVVGRSITQSSDPIAAFNAILAQMTFPSGGA